MLIEAVICSGKPLCKDRFIMTSNGGGSTAAPAAVMVAAFVNAHAVKTWDGHEEALQRVKDLLKLATNTTGFSAMWRKETQALRDDFETLPQQQTRRIVQALIRRGHHDFKANSGLSWRPQWYLIAGLVGAASSSWVVDGSQYPKKGQANELMRRLTTEVAWLSESGLCCRSWGWRMTTEGMHTKLVPADSSSVQDQAAAPAPAGGDSASTDRANDGPSPASPSPWLQSKRCRTSSSTPPIDLTEEASDGVGDDNDADADDGADARNNVVATSSLLRAYDTLGVHPTMPLDEIRRVYRQKILAAHPDKGGSSAAFQAIHAAWSLINS